uniref:SRCR domain-containing protein n=1 Tax=Meloidogyne javanica TaxID=6303 RepID=A0A915M244_MELJA
MNIETGVQLYFDTGVGMKVYGTLKAIGNEFAHIQFNLTLNISIINMQMLPYQEQHLYQFEMPDFRLIDGPTVRQGRLQVKFRDRWRSVCTQLTNWTSIDTSIACRSLGYEDGGFWRFFARNNDTYPFVMPSPKCLSEAKNLWDCEGFSDHNLIPLSENLCQGEDDIGIYCWGRPSFRGWSKHWKGLHIFHSPYGYVPADPDGVALQKESHSRLEFLDILFAGYDRLSGNTTAGLYIEGVPPLMNGLRVERSARDGIQFFEPEGPIILANSTVALNRGHGIAIIDTLDGRVFINQTRIDGNHGDGIWYRQRHVALSTSEHFLGIGIGSRAKDLERGGSSSNTPHLNQGRKYFSFREKPRLEMCSGIHQLPKDFFFPHLILAHLQNGTSVPDRSLQPKICWLNVALPDRLPYAYTIQFLDVINRHSLNSDAQTVFVVCDGNSTFPMLCQFERYRLPLLNGILPQSISLNSNGNPMLIGIEYIPQQQEYINKDGISTMSPNVVAADVEVLFRIHATVNLKAFYGLNITNSFVRNNTGNGIQALAIHDRLALHNVSVDGNQGIAGLLVRDGAADIWINDTSLSWNWGDGVNISFAGGAINVNASRIIGNKWRGFAFHHNSSSPFWPLHQEIVFKGRPINNIFYPKMTISENAWGGLLVGNFCGPSLKYKNWDISRIEPNILISWTEFNENNYHPHIEIFSCQKEENKLMRVDISGNSIYGGTGMGFRMEPCVNTQLVLNSNRFYGILNTALLIRNAKHPQLQRLPAKVYRELIYIESLHKNIGQYIVSIGLNEDAEDQTLLFNQQNEVRENTVINPFPFLKPRSTPYAALVVSSSNVVIRHNCFGNPNADFEIKLIVNLVTTNYFKIIKIFIFYIGTELSEHAKRIDARENNWGYPSAQKFMDRIYDQFNRYSLASIDINPYAAVCNQRSPSLTLLQQYFRPFRQPGQPFHIGGTIFENNDLPVGRYIVTDDLHITPGAKLTLAPGTTFEFMGGIGMLVQGELLRTETSSSPLQPILFTSKPLGQPPRSENIRLVDEFGSDRVLAGRLEVHLGTSDNDNEQWGTVCNRSWTVQHAQLACNQLGLILDPEHFENWRTFPLAEPDDRPIIMDNIRCEEREFDLTKCRHDGNLHNVKASCRSTEVVGLRCAPPYWAGVRYSLLANPMSYTGLSTMSNWIIQRAGLFDFRLPLLSPALQIDWNYHTFHSLTIRDNYFDGIDIVYNDLTRKPALRNCYIVRNRRNGMVVRSMGLSAEKLSIQQNGNAGVRYLPRISTSLQRDIVSWLDRREQPELEANGIFIIPNYQLKRFQLFESQLEQRRFLVSKPTEDCPINEQCNFEIELEAIGNQYGMPAKLLINRPNNESDEDAILEDRQTGNKWSARHNTFNFPLVSFGPKMRLTYKRSKGKYSLVLLVLFLDHQEYLDRFLHVYDSIISENQYAVSAVHHSNLTLIDDSAIVNRYAQDKLWFQRVNFTGNIDSVLWVHSPEYNVIKGTPLAEITWHIDNCSVTDNKGPIVDTHRDLYSSANIFHWNFWSNTFANNTGAAIFVHLPDLWDLRSVKKHSFWLTENRFESNLNFVVHLSGYYTFANISSNNFTDNFAPKDLGIVQLLGMEKRLIMERNRFFTNWGAWIVRYEAYSQALFSEEVPAFIQYNYFQFNRFLRPSDEYAEMWPRSYCVGIFGTQRVEIHFNRLRNVLLDFELVAGCKPQLIVSDIDTLNVTHNWWGVANEAELSQRVFDSDDWNSLSLAQFSPFYTTEELFLNFWWDYRRAQLNFASKQGTVDPPAHDLRGRLWGHVKLELDPERWYPFPYHYRPFRPYRITRDLTIMPGASLTIEKNVEVHIWPNVRILVYGDLIADGTLWQPVRFRPINTTEYSEQQGKRGSKYRRRRSTVTPFDLVRAKHFSRGGRSKHLDIEWIFLKQQNNNDRKVYRKKKSVNQDASNNVLLMEDGAKGKLKGFLHFYNATSGETVPSCDKHFTIRNAQVVCRELGFSSQNAYHWLTPQWSYNPKIRIVKTYMEPRECRGFEHTLRLTALLTDWQCMDNEHFNYIHCGQDSSLSNEFIGHWGGITFARYGLDIGEERERKEEGNNGYEKEIASGGDRSILRHVELVGGGRAHNNSLFEAALQIIQR